MTIKFRSVALMGLEQKCEAWQCLIKMEAEEAAIATQEEQWNVLDSVAIKMTSSFRWMVLLLKPNNGEGPKVMNVSIFVGRQVEVPRCCNWHHIIYFDVTMPVAVTDAGEVHGATV
ncbi:hypothetical protein EDB85DRAFT_1900035 [Lactarius pseudohatsudake]|nr:hypothetical protein EDB85DRAFT_1900035 [Lactarius pseudohatsudake]